MSIQSLQKKMRVTMDGSFGPATLKAATDYFKFSTFRSAHFFGQCAHETGQFTTFVENLNYSSKSLQSTFGSYFPGNLADLYARQPEKIASRVYANRMGNGDEASREGWLFRGRGAIELTGKSNYEAFSTYVQNSEIMSNPDLIETEYAFESAIYFFQKWGLWSICDRGVTDDTILQLTKRINGGTNGLSSRMELTKKYLSWLI